MKPYRYNIPSYVDPAEATRIKMRVLFFKRLVKKSNELNNACISWMENQYDIITPEIRDKVKVFIEGPITEDFPQLSLGLLKAVNVPRVCLLNNLFNNMKRSLIDALLMSSEAPPKPKLPKNMNEKLSLFDIDPIELTRQLTLICFSIYSKVKISFF